VEKKAAEMNAFVEAQKAAMVSEGGNE